MAHDADLELVTDAVTSFLADNDPSTMTNVEFRGARYDAGLAWVHFPVKFGGLGVRPDLNRVVESQMRTAGAGPADPTSFFMALAGPTIVTHGTDAQRDRFLRPMFTGEETWCQLFSEPGAGSDFAGLATKAVRDGDEWIVNGQKVWNTMAHLADWGMLVTRTNPDSPKHKGMTYFAVDMTSPGVEVRPLRQITGEAEFNEVYMTDVRIGDDQRIGDEGEGWRVSLTTLMNERTAIGSGSAGGGKPQRGAAANDAVRIFHGLDDAERTAVRRDALMRLWVRAEVGRLTNMRAASAARAGNPGPEGSVAKLEFANLNKDLYSFCIDLMGADGLVGYDYTFRRPDELDATGSSKGPQYSFLRVRANSIEGGTSEILKNIIGEQVLGLPGEPRVDKDVPWIEVPRS
ncbi:MAG: acyl-CoA dehydrogenase family protein [Actinomycetota bacterium]|jgi:alkylation response protein AidB-like acyl-CoA dehydrogenase|nr:acyl-CoA dehydrogenase family protein [Ilumatobacteraceae bacterium]MDA2959579.1 acyl-CoA dehydrogenase family protein [Actinomycetota bacterium]MDA3007613.1 acyl-CoA dehydrogenase family protein [Actinomycetota bacterium]MDA3035576.1 acyl-CoA dehydrogenase family protein [Actinomycetota bacterium]